MDVNTTVPPAPISPAVVPGINPCLNGVNPYMFPPYYAPPLHVNRGPERIENNGTIQPLTVPANSTVSLPVNGRGCRSSGDYNRRHHRGCPRYSNLDRASATLNLSMVGTTSTGQSIVNILADGIIVQTVTLAGTTPASINTTFEVDSFELPDITVQNLGNMSVQVTGGSIRLRGINRRQRRDIDFLPLYNPWFYQSPFTPYY